MKQNWTIELWKQGDTHFGFLYKEKKNDYKNSIERRLTAGCGRQKQMNNHPM
jgi:hypothetical protein